MDQIFTGDALHILKTLRSESVHTCITSPPYFGLKTMEQKVSLVSTVLPKHTSRGWSYVFREIRRVLRNDGTLWLNLGDSYVTGTKGGNKSKLGDKNFTNKGTLDQPLRTYNYGL